jgi:DNA phosphorothioation-dependent restriction protein DptH
MSKEFYKYIASNLISYFSERKTSISPGERFCLKLDNQEMVNCLDQALQIELENDQIKGTYCYNNIYNTYTMHLMDKKDLVIASKINGMTDDFLATLRNAELTINKYPILMITYSTIDTVLSGTGDLASKGMPFNADSLINNIKRTILAKSTQLKIYECVLLKYELERKQRDHYTDKSSLFEYGDLLTVLGRGYFDENIDFLSFKLFKDPSLQVMQDKDLIKSQLEDNHKLFDKIDAAFKCGDIRGELSKEFTNKFITELEALKQQNKDWKTKFTFIQVKEAHKGVYIHEPIDFPKELITVCSESALENSFTNGTNFFIRENGLTPTQKRIRNILIYNDHLCEDVTVELICNKTVKANWINSFSAVTTVSRRNIYVKIKTDGCVFSKVQITDPDDNISFTFLICVLDTNPNFLSEVHSNFKVYIPKRTNKACLRIIGLERKGFIVNPDPNNEGPHNNLIREGQTYNCDYNTSIYLGIDDQSIDIDTGKVDFTLKSGAISIPIEIFEDGTRPTEMTGISAFKLKFKLHGSLKYKNGKIVNDNYEYFTKNPFSKSLEIESQIIKNGWCAVNETINGIEECTLKLTNNVRNAYMNLVNALRHEDVIPSLCFYKGKTRVIALEYVNAVLKEMDSISDNYTLLPEQNDLLFLGCVFNENGEKNILMSPLHPLNVMYQLTLQNEQEIGDVRDNLVEKLTSLYLLPYLKDRNANLYKAIEQKNLPEWRIYAKKSDDKYHGGRMFVKKLVCDKIIDFKSYFGFLFKDLGNNEIRINLINMGDCNEILQGIVSYFEKQIDNNGVSEDIDAFRINIYGSDSNNTVFNVLSDNNSLCEFLTEVCNIKDGKQEIINLLTKNIRWFNKNINSLQKYDYAHITFYEMNSTENNDTGPMEDITTGITLDGLISGLPAVLNNDWYKSGFGIKYASTDNALVKLAILYNSLARVAYTGSTFVKGVGIFTALSKSSKSELDNIYDSSNWVVFVDPKVDLSFFTKDESKDNDLIIIHYSDQYTTTSGYDEITVTRKSKQYETIIKELLQEKGVSANRDNINGIINLFNAINGRWMLHLMSVKKLSGAADNNFSREKMSILSAIKLCLAYYENKHITWIPISLEEMLRVSRGAGLSQDEGILSAKNLGFDHGPASDDILLVGIENVQDTINVYLHPVEVKIGNNLSGVISKAKVQVLNTHDKLLQALWPKENRDSLESKLSRNFIMQLVIVCCEKMKLYKIYPNETWDLVLDTFREALLNEHYVISTDLDERIGKGTIVSFKTEAISRKSNLEDGISIIELPERCGSEYMIKTTQEILEDLNRDAIVGLERIDKYENREIPNDDKTNIQEIKYDPSSEKDVAGQEENTPFDEGDRGNKKAADPSKIDKDKFEEKTMSILFGNDVGTGKKVYWYPNNTDKVFHTNTGIIGTMGTGKTQFTKSLVTQLIKEQNKNYSVPGLGILIFDYKGDYNESKPEFVKATSATIFKPYHLPFNPLTLTKSKVFKPLLPIHTANSFKDTISKVYELGPKQQNTLFSCINKAYEAQGIKANDKNTWDKTPPTFASVYKVYIEDTTIKKTDSLAAAMEKLYQFEVFESDLSKTKSLYDILNGVVVIDLSGYDSDIQSLIVAITLDLFYAQMQAAGSSKMDNHYRQLTKMILVDEADNFMCEGFTSLKKILKEGREFGVGTILSTQFLKHFGSGEDDYSKYIFTWVVHNVSDLKTTDIDFVFKPEDSSEEQQLFNDIKGLEKHRSIVKIGTSKPQYVEDYAFWKLCKDLHLN